MLPIHLGFIIVPQRPSWQAPAPSGVSTLTELGTAVNFYVDTSLAPGSVPHAKSTGFCNDVSGKHGFYLVTI